MATDTLRKQLGQLRTAFRQGKLEFVVGAGASMASGLPSWEEFNRRILRLYFRDVYEQLRFETEDLNRISEVFVQRLGREPVIDLVRAGVGKQEYVSILRDSLYAAGPLELSTIHFELGAAVRASQGKAGNGLYTFNFDDLLERAIALMYKPARASTSGTLPSSPYVVHLHGLIRQVPKQHEGEIILSERDYHRAPNDWAERRLLDVFEDSGKTVLFLGLSLGDPRLRRILLDRLRSRPG